MVKRGRTRSSSWEDLPDDCWEIIFGNLGHDRHLQPISVVCKRFHAIANHVRTNLTFYSSPSSVPLSHLFSRFPNLQSLHLCHPHPRLDRVVRELAVAALPLRSLHLSHQTRFPGEAMRLLGCSSIMCNTLRTLACIHFDCLTDDDLFVVADCFPYLHRLHLHHYAFVNPDKTITDQGICAISAKLTSLLSLAVCTNDFVSYVVLGLNLAPRVAFAWSIFPPLHRYHLSSLSSSM